MRLILASVLLSACTNTPCALHRFDDAPAAGPGEVRHGFAFDNVVDLVATPSGVACLSCGTLFNFDGALHEERHVGVDLDGTGKIAVTNHAAIVFDQDYSPEYDVFDDNYRPPHFQLFALSGSGDELWRKDFADGEAWTGNFPPVGLNGPQQVTPSVVAGPNVVIVYGIPLASVFDAASGRLMWATLTQRGDALAADANVGLFHASGSVAGRPSQATLRHFGFDGGTVWTTTWSPVAPMPFGEITFAGAARTANDGLVVAGEFTTPTLDLGGHILQSPTGPVGPNSASFVAALDDRGATKWAFAVGTKDPTGYVQTQKIAATRDGAVICGEYAGASQLGLPATDGRISAFVARVDASGAITAYPIAGSAVFCQGLDVADDGGAIVMIASGSDLGTTELRVGNRTFDHGPDTTYYVLNISL
jgi:hypothetical protein